MGKVLKFPSKKEVPAQMPELSDRLERIRGSLSKINQLMRELQELSEKERDKNVDSSKR